MLRFPSVDYECLGNLGAIARGAQTHVYVMPVCGLNQPVRPNLRAMDRSLGKFMADLRPLQTFQNWLQIFLFLCVFDNFSEKRDRCILLASHPRKLSAQVNTMYKSFKHILDFVMINILQIHWKRWFKKGAVFCYHVFSQPKDSLVLYVMIVWVSLKHFVIFIKGSPHKCINDKGLEFIINKELSHLNKEIEFHLCGVPGKARL